MFQRGKPQLLRLLQRLVRLNAGWAQSRGRGRVQIRVHSRAQSRVRLSLVTFWVFGVLDGSFGLFLRVRLEKKGTNLTRPGPRRMRKDASGSVASPSITIRRCRILGALPQRPDGKDKVLIRSTLWLPADPMGPLTLSTLDEISHKQYFCKQRLDEAQSPSIQGGCGNGARRIPARVRAF